MSWRYCFLWLAIPVFVCRLNAHTISLTYAEVTVDEQQVRWSLKLPIPELDLLLGLDENHDGQVDAAEVMRSQPRIQQYVMLQLGVHDDGRQVPGSIGSLRLWKDPEGHLFIQTEAVFAAQGASFGKITLHCDMLRTVVAAHQTLAKITSGGKTIDFVFENGRDFEANANPSTFQTILQFVHIGIMHIFTGYDHVAFLLGVVLIGGSFTTILKVVTSFTLAHSITLALAAFHLVELPSRLVESGIALSIIYIAVENLFFQKFDRRWIVTFFFGLVHGFGFASALAEVHLSRQLLATALFSFNLGVETGQLCIVAALLPALLYMSRLRFNTLIIKGCSAVIFVLGSFWLWQRVWETTG
jgi:hydrogenase/urease accessory protein HupE